MRKTFLSLSLAMASSLSVMTPTSALAVCTFAAVPVVCPAGVTDGSFVTSLKNIGLPTLGANWSDGAMSAGDPFANKIGGAAGGTAEFDNATTRFTLGSLSSPGPGEQLASVPTKGVTGRLQTALDNGTASVSQVTSVIEGDDALLTAMTNPPATPPTTSVLDFLGPAATDPTAFDFSPTNFLQTPRHRSRPVFRQPPRTSVFLTPTVPFEPFPAGTQPRQNPGTPLNLATPPPAGSTVANDDTPGSSEVNSSTELYSSLPYSSQGQSADSYQNQLRPPPVVGFDPASLGWGLFQFAPPKIAIGALDGTSGGGADSTLDPASYLPPSRPLGFEAEATSWLTLHDSRRLAVFAPDDKLRTSVDRSGTAADRASEILWLREMARAERATADSSLTADPEPVGNVDLTFDNTPPTGTFTTTDQPSDDGQTSGNSTTTPPATNPLVPISTLQVEKRTESGGVVVTRTTEVTQNPNGSVTTTTRTSNSRDDRTSTLSETVTTGTNPDGSTTETITYGGGNGRSFSVTVTTRTNSDGSTTMEKVNSRGRRIHTSTTMELGDGVTRIVSTNLYDVTRTDTIQPDGSIDRFAVDKDGRTLWSSTARINADGSTTETTQRSTGGYTRTTWPNGTSSETRRNNIGIVVQITVTLNPDGSTTRTFSPNNGNTSSSTTRKETVSVFEDGSSVTMDSAGNPILETRPGTISVVAQDDGTVIIGDTAAVTDGVLRFLNEAIVIN